MAGPASDFATYDALVKDTLFTFPPPSTPTSALTSSRSQKAVKKSRKLRSPALRKTVAYQKLAIGLMFLGIYALYGGKAGHDKILDGKWWFSHSKLWRFGFIQLAGFIARTKYYAVWTVAEGACVLTGLGFNGYDARTGKTLWNRVSNVVIWDIETAQSFKVLFDSWNCRANVWLRDTIYKRVTPPGKKPGFRSTLITFLTSAFWVGRPFRHLIRPFFLPTPPQKTSVLKTFYDAMGWFFTQSSLNYLVLPFFLLDLKSAITGWHHMGWYGHIMIFGAYIALKLGGRAWLVSLNKRAGRPPPKKTIPAEAKKREF
ncbi:hypothetical protein QFC21_003564 [Naganishia friedmannii]|uniref:Uncharacterized protein n=1 Tax=Naganishia friedmannii TaxID=89922 RepID=A0ACC2VN30_9TREE|nr:hypothetical protein QFC21_003564 [Naganishia friedmannii]